MIFGDVRNFTQKLERGLFSLYILWKASEQSISGTDLSELERKHGHEVSSGRLYPTFHDLMEKRYLAMEEVVEHGKIHKYYKTTGEGKELLKKVRDELGEPMKDFLIGWIGESFYNIEIGEKEKKRRKESEESILQIVKDDILRIMGEDEKEKVSLKFIKSKIKASSSFISEAIGKLEKESLIQLEKDFVILTEKGRDEAGSIVKRHSILEDYFKRKRSEDEAHKAADILEHYVSVEVLNNIKRLSTFKGRGFPLTELELNRENLITDIEFSVGGLFERMVSMGIFPGEKIKIIHNIPDGFVVDVSGKKIAIGKDIAKRIEVVK